MASKWLWFIFQFPLIRGLRGASGPGIGRLSQGLQPWKLPVLQELEGRSPAGGHVVDVAGQPEGGQGSRAVAPSDDREASTAGNRLGDGARPSREAIVLEHPHGPVPEHRAGVGDLVGELRRRARSDVEALPALGYVPAYLPDLLAIRRQGHDVGRNHDSST